MSINVPLGTSSQVRGVFKVNLLSVEISCQTALFVVQRQNIDLLRFGLLQVFVYNWLIEAS